MFEIENRNLFFAIRQSTLQGMFVTILVFTTHLCLLHIHQQNNKIKIGLNIGNLKILNSFGLNLLFGYF